MNNDIEKDLATARMLVQISNEVTNVQNDIVETTMKLMLLSRALSAIQQRVQAATHHVLEADPPARFGENTSFGIAVFREKTDAATSPGLAPQTHDGRETVTASPAGEVGVGKGSDAKAPGVVSGMTPQSEQDVKGDAPVLAGASLEGQVPEAFGVILNRFAETGHSHNELADEFGVRVSVVSQCLQIARATNDRRVATGDLKRNELMEGKEPGSKPAAAAPKPSRVKRVAHATKPEAPALDPVKTIKPLPADIGRPLVSVNYTDGVAVRDDTHQDVRIPGPPLRILAYLRDQRWYELPDVMRAARLASEPIFRTTLADLQRALGQIGLHIAEDVDRGFQLRRIVQVSGGAEAA